MRGNAGARVPSVDNPEYLDFMSRVYHLEPPEGDLRQNFFERSFVRIKQWRKDFFGS
ncbi:MAG: hypothetical protein V1787_01575 [Candidatus Micrarchaeota archaeon]